MTQQFVFTLNKNLHLKRNILSLINIDHLFYYGKHLSVTNLQEN